MHLVKTAVVKAFC